MGMVPYLLYIDIATDLRVGSAKQQYGFGGSFYGWILPLFVSAVDVYFGFVLVPEEFREDTLILVLCFYFYKTRGVWNGSTGV